MIVDRFVPTTPKNIRVNALLGELVVQTSHKRSSRTVVKTVYLDVFHVLYLFEKRIGLLWVEAFVAPHQRDHVLRIRKVDDVVGVTRNHLNYLKFLARNPVLDNGIVIALFVLANSAKTNQALSRDNAELLPLRMMPMLALGDSGLRNVDGNLTAIGSAQHLGKASAIVNVHLKFVRKIARVKIRKIRGV